MKRRGIRKHIAVLLAVLTAALFMAGCGARSTPTKSTDVFLKALKAQDNDAIAEVYSGGKLDLIDSLAEAQNDPENADSGFYKILQEQLIPKIMDFDYELSNEQILDDKATVDVNIKTYRIGEAFTSFFTDYISQAFVLAFSDPSEEALDELAAQLLTEKLEGLTDKSYEITTTINLTNVEGKWMVDEFDVFDEVMDAITGGLYSSFNGMDDILSGWDF